MVYSTKGVDLMFKVKVCQMCAKEFQPTSGAAKVCLVCKPLKDKMRQQEYHQNRYKQKGAYKWEMPKGVDSPFYKNGIGIFRKQALSVLPNICNRCESTSNLCVHHKDYNRSNNDVGNWEILCKSCHQQEHLVRDEYGRFTTLKV